MSRCSMAMLLPWRTTYATEQFCSSPWTNYECKEPLKEASPLANHQIVSVTHLAGSSAWGFGPNALGKWPACRHNLTMMTDQLPAPAGHLSTDYRYHCALYTLLDYRSLNLSSKSSKLAQGRQEILRYVLADS